MLEILILILVIALVGFIFLESFYRTREYAPTEFLPNSRTKWNIINNENEIIYTCKIPIKNFSNIYEATVVDVVPQLRILYKDKKEIDINIDCLVIPEHYEARNDGYWPAYILTPQKELDTKIIVTFSGNLEKIKNIQSIIITLNYKIYSRRNLEYKRCELILVPLQTEILQPKPIENDRFILFPIKTHILTDIDDIVEVIDKYTKDLRKDGDIVTIAESVLAITQRRYKIPDIDIKPGWWAKRLCFFVPNVGSLSSRYGMQAAIEEVGLFRILLGLFIGALFKLIGKKGWFYIIAGIQSELIDDVSGTMPPYDKYIVLGPIFSEEVVQKIKKELGIEAAVVDVNNLKRVRILAASSGVDKTKLSQSLIDNPSGNSCEQTPFVIVRFKD